MKKSRKDNNHNNIVRAFTELFIPFCDLSALGNGVPDGLIWLKGSWEFVEIKNLEWGYGRNGLSMTQLAWLSKFRGAKVYIVESLDDVIAIANGQKESVKWVRG